jgi:hypothetical protein
MANMFVSPIGDRTVPVNALERKTGRLTLAPIDFLSLSEQGRSIAMQPIELFIEPNHVIAEAILRTPVKQNRGSPRIPKVHRINKKIRIPRRTTYILRAIFQNFSRRKTNTRDTPWAPIKLKKNIIYFNEAIPILWN